MYTNNTGTGVNLPTTKKLARRQNSTFLPLLLLVLGIQLPVELKKELC